MRSLVALIAVALLCLGSACTDEDVSTDDAASTSASLQLPRQIVGLTLLPEKINPKDLERVDRPYVDNIAVFSLREDELLRGTLQVARFNRLARPGDGDFRGEIVGLLGGQRPFDIRVGDVDVNASTGTSQSIFSWFGGRGMFILSIQQDYPFPRTLLRRIVERDLEL